MFDWYVEWEYRLAFLQLFFAMLGMGATLGPSDLIALARAPKPLLTGLITQLGAIPLLAVLVAAVFGFTPGAAVGLILIGAVPGGTFSNVLCYLLGANYSLSIAMTTISTLACLATTPLLLRAFAANHLPDDFSMPVEQVMSEIGFGLLLPLFVGMFVGSRLATDGSRRFTRICILLSLGAVAIMILGSSGAGRVDPVMFADLLPGMLAFSTLALLAGVVPGRFFGVVTADRTAIGVETCVRNVNLAFLVKASVFPALAGAPDPFVDGVFAALLVSGSVQLLPAIPLMVGYRRGWF